MTSIEKHRSAVSAADITASSPEQGRPGLVRFVAAAFGVVSRRNWASPARAPDVEDLPNWLRRDIGLEPRQDRAGWWNFR